MNWTNLISLIMSAGMTLIGIMSIYLSMKGDKRQEFETHKKLTETIEGLKSSVLVLNTIISEIKSILIDKVSKEVFNSEISGLSKRVDKIENTLKK